jgi:hypothetical protein
MILKMEINQQSFTQVAFAETLHRGVKRLLKAIHAEYLLTQKLDAAVKEKEAAIEFVGKNLVPLSDAELLILAKNYPDIERFIGHMLESRKETSEIEAAK